MTHDNKPNPLPKARRQMERATDLYRYASLLWDPSKPPGEEGVPEEQWYSLLAGPCNYNHLLIAEVCAYERWLRSDPEYEPFTFAMTFRPGDYLKFLNSFFADPLWPLPLLWDESRREWHPEEQWDELLQLWMAEPKDKDGLKNQARQLREAREKGRYEITL
jgi:hypothetical protein